MKLTIIQTGDVAEPLQPRFGLYPIMFEKMFEHAGQGFEYETVPVHAGAPFPDVASLEGIIVPGSAAGVYDDLPWIEPLRVFIRQAYAERVPMLGVCFGHQAIADALGGDVRKSEKGWGLGRHTYNVTSRPAVLGEAPPALAVACSHQDQVITAPPEAEVFLASEFTPNAGLVYRNGATITLQPHPEFEDGYATALAERRRGLAPDPVIETALASFAAPSHSRDVAGYLGEFLRSA